MKDELARINEKLREEIVRRKDAEEALKRSEGKYRALVEQVPAVTYIAGFGEAGDWVYVSPQIETLLGFTVDEWRSPGTWLSCVHPDDRTKVLKKENEARISGQAFVAEYRMIAKDGSLRWVRDHGVIVFDDLKQPLYLQGLLMDITSTVLDHQALRESEERFQRVSLATNDATWDWDLSANKFWGNAKYQTVFGTDSKDSLLEVGYWTESIHPQDRDRVVPGIYKVIEGQSTFWSDEYRLRRRDGSYAQVFDRGYVIRDSEGKGIRMIGAVLDITDRLDTEVRLRETRRQLELAAQGANIGLWTWRMQEKTAYLSPEWKKQLGYEDDELPSTVEAWDTRLHPDDSERAIRHLKEYLDGKHENYESEFRLRHRDGSYRWFLSRGSLERNADGIAVRMSGCHIDITARKHLEDFLATRARNEAGLAELGKQALVSKDVVAFCKEAVNKIGNILEMEFCAITEFVPKTSEVIIRAGTGWSPELIGRTASALDRGSQSGYTLSSTEPVILEDASTETRFELTPAMKEAQIVSGISVTIHGKDRPFGVLAVHSREKRIFVKGEIEFLKSAANVLGAAIARSQVEEARERVTSILEATPDFVGIASEEAKVIYLNRSARVMIGIQEEEDLTECLIAEFHPEWAAKKILEEGIPSAVRSGLWSGESALHTRDGREIPVSQVIIAHKSEDGLLKYVSTIAHDISEVKIQEQNRLQLEEQLRQAQKMEAIGQLAGGVAHDFNNILMAITSYCELMLAKLGTDHPVAESIYQALNAAERGAVLTARLLAFGRRQLLSPKILDLNKEVENNKIMLERLLGADVILKAVLAPDLGNIEADPGQLEQILLNLASNARDAMPNGGNLTLETGNIELDQTVANDYAIAPGKYVTLKVSDSGSGMDQRARSHLFEPFFTTKEQGKGTGLGLSSVYGIVKQSGGHIAVETVVGKGTTFIIYFPRLETSCEPQKPVAPSLKTEVKGKETILFVDDNDSVRISMSMLLEMSGYKVLAAADALAALDVASAHEGPIQLLITDVVMPKMSGTELSRRLIERNPMMKVIYISGYAEDVLSKGEALLPGSAFLQKPTSVKALIEKARELLSSAAG